MTGTESAHRWDDRPTVRRAGDAKVATVAALRAYAAEIRDAEVARAIARLDGLCARDRFVVRALAERLVGELLHRPLTVLNADADGANAARVVRQLFLLDV